MKISRKRQAGEVLGRGGISQRIIILSTDISQGGYENAIEKAGQIAVLVQAATYDEYWNEKARMGEQRENGVLAGLLEGELLKERVIRFVNPYLPS